MASTPEAPHNIETLEAVIAQEFSYIHGEVVEEDEEEQSEPEDGNHNQDPEKDLQQLSGTIGAILNDEKMPYTTTTVEERTEYYAPQSNTVQLEMPDMETSYLKTLGGIMKIVCIALCLLTFLCVLIGGPGYYSGAGWATFVSTVGLSITTLLLFLYVFKVVDSVPQINWIICEMVYTFIWTIFFFIAGSVLAVASVQYAQTAGWAIAAFFALAAMCAYGFDCYLKFLQWKHNEVATGRGKAFFQPSSA
ncbi:unnamed protein product, partial [Mesorhabditis spiculigera]